MSHPETLLVRQWVGARAAAGGVAPQVKVPVYQYRFSHADGVSCGTAWNIRGNSRPAGWAGVDVAVERDKA
ncbi:hypothetical protein ACTU45_19575 [Streptomyces sp. 24-1644]|uniref:hypothetical protein n=1 Tax=Streptomyces sp. 24-1644 TaxID=3457315 RepID=UPI003FA7C802